MSKISYAEDISSLVKEYEPKLKSAVDVTLNGCDSAFLFLKDNEDLHIYDYADINGILFNIFLNKENEKVWVSKDFNEENYTLHLLMVGQIALYLNETLNLGLNKALIKKIAHFHDTEEDDRGILEKVSDNELDEILKKYRYVGLEDDIREGMILSKNAIDNLYDINYSKNTIKISLLGTQIVEYGQKEHMLVKLADNYHQFFSGTSTEKLLIAKTLFYTKLFKKDLGREIKKVTKDLINHRFSNYDRKYVEGKLSDMNDLRKQYKNHFIEMSRQYLEIK